MDQFLQRNPRNHPNFTFEDSQYFNQVQNLGNIEDKIKVNIQKYFNMMGDQIYNSVEKVEEEDISYDQTSVVRTQFSNRDLIEEQEKPIQFYSNMTISQSATNGLRADPAIFYKQTDETARSNLDQTSLLQDDYPQEQQPYQTKALTSSEFTILKGIIQNLGNKIKQLEIESKIQNSKLAQKEDQIKKYKRMALKPGRVSKSPIPNKQSGVAKKWQQTQTPQSYMSDQNFMSQNNLSLKNLQLEMKMQINANDEYLELIQQLQSELDEIKQSHQFSNKRFDPEKYDAEVQVNVLLPNSNFNNEWQQKCQQYEIIIGQAQQQLEKFNKDVQEKDGVIQQLQKENAQLKNVKLEDQQSQNPEQISLLESQISDQQKQIEKLKKDLSKKDERIAKIGASISDKEEQMMAYKKREEKNQEQIEKMQKMLNQNQSQSELQNKEKEKLKDRIAQLEKTIEDLESSKPDLDLLTSEFEEKIQEKMKQKDAQHQQMMEQLTKQMGDQLNAANDDQIKFKDLKKKFDNQLQTLQGKDMIIQQLNEQLTDLMESSLGKKKKKK